MAHLDVAARFAQQPPQPRAKQDADESNRRTHSSRRGWPHLNLVVGFLLIAVLQLAGQTVTAQPAPVPESASIPDANYDKAQLVLAYYYAWWEPEKITGALDTPTQRYPAGIRQLGDDPALLREHIQQAQVAGIDGFIVNRTQDLVTLLDVAKGSDFRVSLHVDVTQDARSQLRQFYRNIDHPNLVRYHGRPVVFFWQSRSLNNDTWSDLRAELDPDHTALWIADGDRFDILAGDAWDGISPYAIAWSSNPRSQLPAWAAKARAVAPNKLFVPPVSPGCDDRQVRVATCVQDRADGAYYRATWEGALAAKPGWAVVVSTFNEWMEATEIEPSLQYGDLYLQLTREYSDRFNRLAQATSSAAPGLSLTRIATPSWQ